MMIVMTRMYIDSQHKITSGIKCIAFNFLNVLSEFFWERDVFKCYRSIPNH